MLRAVVVIAIWAHRASVRTVHLECSCWRSTWLELGPSLVLHAKALSEWLDDVHLLEWEGILGHKEVGLLQLAKVQLWDDVFCPVPQVSCLPLESGATHVLCSVIDFELVEIIRQRAILLASVVGGQQHFFATFSIDAHNGTVLTNVATASAIVRKVEVEDLHLRACQMGCSPHWRHGQGWLALGP